MRIKDALGKCIAVPLRVGVGAAGWEAAPDFAEGISLKSLDGLSSFKALLICLHL